MDLIKYDQSLVGKGQGFINLGATCYFNSLLQCLLSCDAFRHFVASVSFVRTYVRT